MTVEQQLAYWRHQARKHEKMAKDRSDYDDLKREAGEARRLRKERETETERAVREAAEKGRSDTLAEVAPRLVLARFEVAAAGRIQPDRLAVLTEDVDLGRYVRADGTVDTDKVASRVDAWAPADTRGAGPRPDTSQGSRGTPTTGTDVGREMFEARRRRTRTTP